MKQYPAVESLSNSSPSASLNSENEKRNSQQQVIYYIIMYENISQIRCRKLAIPHSSYSKLAYAGISIIGVLCVLERYFRNVEKKN